MKPSKFYVNFALRKHISLEQLHFQSAVIPQGHQLPYIRQQIFRLLVRSWNPHSPMSHSDLMANRLEIQKKLQFESEDSLLAEFPLFLGR